MTGFLLLYDGMEPIHELLIAVPFAQTRAQVVLGHAEEAGADFAVRCQPNAIAGAAEGLADRSNHANLSLAIGKHPAPGSRGGVVGWRRSQIETGLQTGQHFTRRHN